MDKKKQQELRMKAILYDMDNGNKNCVDCDKESMDFASINNGVILCAECADKHRDFGNGISYWRGWGERWDDYLWNYIKTGGNSRFNIFAKSYKINNIELVKKYKTRACDYYREILRSEVMGYDPPDNISLNTASEVLENIENNYPEFDNYSFVKHVDWDILEKNFGNNKEAQGFMSSMKGFFGSFTKTIDHAADMWADKVSDLNVLEKGAKAWDVVKSSVGSATGTISEYINDIVGEEDNDEEEKEKAKEEASDPVNVEVSGSEEQGNNIDEKVIDSTNEVQIDKISNEDKTNSDDVEEKDQDEATNKEGTKTAITIPDDIGIFGGNEDEN